MPLISLGGGGVRREDVEECVWCVSTHLCVCVFVCVGASTRGLLWSISFIFSPMGATMMAEQGQQWLMGTKFLCVFLGIWCGSAMGGGRYGKLGVNEGQGNWAGVATSFRHTWAQTCRAARRAVQPHWLKDEQEVIYELREVRWVRKGGSKGCRKMCMCWAEGLGATYSPLL